MAGRQNRPTHLNVRMSDTGRWILLELQEYLGLSQASVVELLLREEARRRDITIPGSGRHLADIEQQEELARKIAEEAAASLGRTKR